MLENEIIEKNNETYKKIFENKEKLNNIRNDLNLIENILYDLNFYDNEKIENEIFKTNYIYDNENNLIDIKINENDYYIKTLKKIEKKYNYEITNNLYYRNLKDSYLTLYRLINDIDYKNILNENYNLIRKNIIDYEK